MLDLVVIVVLCNIHVVGIRITEMVTQTKHDGYTLTMIDNVAGYLTNIIREG